MELRDAGVSYPSGQGTITALRDVDLCVDRGDFLTISGPSGSGKTTILNLLGTLLRPTDGRVLLSGVDLHGLKDKHVAAMRNRSVGFVFQSFHLLPRRTALENVAMPLLYARRPRAAAKQLAMTYLDELGLGGRALSFPDQLSGGERQRVAIARAMAMGPELLLCDEPTGNLDRETSDAVLAALVTLNSRGVTLVVVTHDEDIAGMGARSIHVRSGRLVSPGVS